MKKDSNLNLTNQFNVESTFLPIDNLTTKSLIVLFNRLSLFVVYFWFGYLKVISDSPAEQLIAKLYLNTIPFMGSKESFIFSLGIVECLIGILWLIPQLTRWAFWFLIVHMITTFSPFLFITEDIIDQTFHLSLAGQYIVKNIVLVGCALSLYSERIIR